MEIFESVYIQNKKLDEKFDQLYGIYKEDIIEKNKLELLVELGELANETKCFKYWSLKTPDKDKVLEEFADCLLMVLLFCNMLNIKLDEDFPIIKEANIIREFNNLFLLSADLNNNFNQENVKCILSHLINLASLLNLSNNEIIEASLNKINKNYTRFEEGF